MNFIDGWFEEMQLIKWGRVLHNDAYFRNLDAIKAEIDGFFPKEDFNKKDHINPDNWLLHIFANKQDGSIYIVNETAELIRYLRKLSDQESYHLKNNNGKINYKSLQEKLYEIYVRYLFDSFGLKSNNGQSYSSNSGNVKEIDLLLTIDGEAYNVEITKFYDVFKEGLLALTEDIVRKLTATIVKRVMTHDELCSGYFAFKARDEALIKKNKQLIGVQIKKFLHGYRSSSNNTLAYPSKIETDEFEFELESMFNNHYDNKYDQYLSSFPGSIKFRISGDVQTKQAHVEAIAICKESAKDQNIRLQNKIKEKLKQHRDSPYPLLIVIGIEQIFSTHAKNRTIAIRRNEINIESIHKIISHKAILLIIFKEVNNKGINYQRMILGDGIQHANLIPILKNLNLAVRYMPIA